jgi:group I intron endonuclease
MNSVSGIYKIYCEGNNKVYIGSSVNVRKRRNEHLHHLRGNKHPNRHLQHSYNKYGEASFGFSVVLECEKEILLIEEEKCIRKYNSYNEGFNLIERIGKEKRQSQRLSNHRTSKANETTVF